ncbi:MAG TPA: hypothetical protein VIS07_03925 [Candidatus Binatia bacterium]
MNELPLRCVVDTNVLMTANGANPAVSAECAARSASALAAVMASGHVFLDSGRRILREYGANLDGAAPGPGTAFYKWLLTHEWNERAVTRVRITRLAGDEERYLELPEPDDGTVYDPSDRKFLAVAAADPEHPPILQSFDSKWWGWRDALAKLGVVIHFLCADEIARKYAEKHSESHPEDGG